MVSSVCIKPVLLNPVPGETVLRSTVLKQLSVLCLCRGICWEEEAYLCAYCSCGQRDHSRSRAQTDH